MRLTLSCRKNSSKRIIRIARAKNLSILSRIFFVIIYYNDIISASRKMSFRIYRNLFQKQEASLVIEAFFNKYRSRLWIVTLSWSANSKTVQDTVISERFLTLNLSFSSLLSFVIIDINFLSIIQMDCGLENSKAIKVEKCFNSSSENERKIDLW